MMVVACSATAAAIALGLAASAYQPLGMWNETGQYYIPHQRWTFAASVSLVDNGPFPVTMRCGSRQRPNGSWPEMSRPGWQPGGLRRSRTRGVD